MKTAHINDLGEKQSLKEHLSGTAERAEPGRMTRGHERTADSQGSGGVAEDQQGAGPPDDPERGAGCGEGGAGI